MTAKIYGSALAMVVATILTHQVAAPPIAQFDRAPAHGNNRPGPRLVAVNGGR